MNRLVSCTVLLAVVAVWGWTFSLMKGPVETYGVVSFLAVRFVLGAAAISLAAARRTTWRTLRVGGPIGLVLAAAYLVQTYGLRHTTATNTGLITGLFVVFAPLANRLLFGVRTRPALWVAVGISVVGLAMLAGGGLNGVAPGDVVTVGAAALFGLHIALLDRHAKHHDAIVLAQGQLTVAAAVFLLVWPLAEPVRLPPPGWSLDAVWPALLVTGLVATAAAFLVQTYVQQRLRAVPTAMIIVTEPLFAALFGYLIGGDRLTGMQMAGAGLMVAALVLAELYPLMRKPRRRGEGDRRPNHPGAHENGARENGM
jgi:drug/metabolite transporter (DMT)-like permease